MIRILYSGTVYYSRLLCGRWQANVTYRPNGHRLQLICAIACTAFLVATSRWYTIPAGSAVQQHAMEWYWYAFT
jgi:hypothetical protein